MTRKLRLGETVIEFTCKDVKHVHLSVHPPEGRVTLVAPIGTRSDVARAYAISRLRWIRSRQAEFQGQAREPQKEMVNRETHYVWGRRHLLEVTEREVRPAVHVDHRKIVLSVRPGSSLYERSAVLRNWQRAQLHEEIPRLLAKWEPKLGVSVKRYFVQRMKTKWGSCNSQSQHIRLNTELVKKPKDLLEYVVVHEMMHLLEPTHSSRFIALMDRHYPRWREARSELNELPL